MVIRHGVYEVRDREARMRRRAAARLAGRVSRRVAKLFASQGRRHKAQRKSMRQLTVLKIITAISICRSAVVRPTMTFGLWAAVTVLVLLMCNAHFGQLCLFISCSLTMMVAQGVHSLLDR